MPTDDEILTDWLATHDESCPICRYSLLRATTPTCPECGAPLQLTISSPNAAIGPWSLCVISFSLAIGFDGVALILLGGSLGMMLVTGGLAFATDGPRVLMFLSPLIVLAIASAFGLRWFFRNRRAWGRISVRHQWRWAWAVFVTVGFAHVIGGVLMYLLGPD